jgi:glycosyltransferase involved in cell wall biosynthesis
MHKILHPKLVILSYAFAPSVGGIETVSQILAKSFVQRGYEVTVITNTACGNVESAEPFHIVRQPSIKTLVSQIYRTDIVLQCHISLRIAWPMWFMFIRKPFILTLHTQIASPNRAAMWLGRLKHIFLLRPRCLFVSNYLAETIKPGACAIWNPYDNSVFRLLPGVVRSRDLIFVGRLVFAKGVDILLRAFALVLKYRPSTSLSVVGSGQEENNLQKLACTLGIEQNTDFLGIRKGNELASLMSFLQDRNRLKHYPLYR